MRTLAAAILAFVSLRAGAQAAAPRALDSQVVLNRYAARLLREEGPKVLVFSYTVSQAGPRAIEQTHRMYRSGDLVRDETIMSDGVPKKDIRIARYRNRYTLDNLAPRTTQYAFLFERSARSGGSLSYTYRAVPLGAVGAFVIDAMTIDGRSYLPLEIHFHTAAASSSGHGAIAFARSGKYWVPFSATVDARIAGKPARERITFGAYQFPASLPKATFRSPRPLRTPVPPTS
ncbi:MAG TPA: hypothetical protein VFE17_03990 [Candidatus Baltobacteraceae bacterium]|nr:hypothetical protein [Candidatus Baltobacteraceae bacterium]